MTEVTLTEILAAREKRAAWQQAMLQKYRLPIVCFTMNIAGPVKITPLIQRGFQAGLDALDRQIPMGSISERLIDTAPTGNTAIYVVNMDAALLKQICTSIEESTPLGRLFDMDVLTPDGKKLERPGLRGCIVCGAPGRGCAAGRLHSVRELQHVTNGILTKHFKLADREHLTSIAVQSLIDEVNTTPKPGLVDRRNNGSHKDMTIAHFIASAQALGPYFRECVKIGQDTAAQEPQATFLYLRQAGLEAEKTMYSATDGVNTHKGVIYTLGILCGCLGRLWTPEQPVGDYDTLLSECRKMVADFVKSDLSKGDQSTHGLQLYHQYGIGGIRAEVAAGLPSVTEISLPVYRKYIADGLTPNDAGVLTLLHLITHVEDTNLHHRGGIDGAKWATEKAKILLNSSCSPTQAQIEALDDAFITRNLSPGGCADLLAATYFLHTLYP